MRISKDVIIIEEDFILKVNLDSPYQYYNYFWMKLDVKNDDLISKEIYIGDIKVDDSRFEVEGYFIKIEFENMYNKQTKKKIDLFKKLKNNLIIIHLTILCYISKVL